MAITIEESPEQNTASSKCFRWVLSQTAPADLNTTIRKIIYQLILSDGTKVTEIESSTYTGKDLPLDFKIDVIPFLGSFLPDLQTQYNHSITDMIVGFKLKYAEQDFDKTTCADPGDPTFTESAEKKVWHIYPGFDERPLENISTIPLFLTYKPIGVLKMARGQRDFLYFAPGDQNINLTLRQYDLDGALVQTNVFGFSGGLDNIICFGIGGINTPGVSDVSQLSYIELDFLYGAGDNPLGTWKIVFHDACSDIEYRELYFVEPLGTISSIRFDESQFAGLRSTQKGQNQAFCTDSDTGNKGFVSGGTNVVRSTSFRKITLRKYIKGSDEWAKFYDGLISSAFHWLAVKNPSGNLSMSRFIVDDAQIPYKDDQIEGILTISGRLHKEIYTHEQWTDTIGITI